MRSSFWHKISRLIRKYPGLTRIAYSMFRWTQPRYTLGVTAVIINELGQVLLVEHVFHPRNPWGLPGGWVNRNEHPVTSVKRELKEELELEISVKSILYMETTVHNHLDISYFCCADNDIGNLSFELLNYRWCDISELPRLRNFHYQSIVHAQRLMEGMEE